MSKEKKEVNIVKKAWNLTKAITKYAAYGFKTVPVDVYTDRMVECNKCEHLVKDRGACGLCGCDISVKGQWSTEECPDGRWGSTILPNAKGLK